MTTYSGTCGELSVTLGGLEGTLQDDDSYGASIDRWWFGLVWLVVWFGLDWLVWSGCWSLGGWCFVLTISGTMGMPMAPVVVNLTII